MGLLARELRFNSVEAVRNMKIGDVVPWKRGGKGSAPSILDESFEPTWSSLHREVGRLFDDFASRLSGFEKSSLIGFPGSEIGFVPKVNVNDSPTEYVVTAELPGMTEKELEITVSGDRLVLRGERKKEEKKTEHSISYYESSYGAFERVIPLEDAVEDDKIDAKMSNGVLTIKLPKTASSSPKIKKISIRNS